MFLVEQKMERKVLLEYVRVLLEMKTHKAILMLLLLFLFAMPESKQLRNLSTWFHISHESTNSHVTRVNFNCSCPILFSMKYNYFH